MARTAQIASVAMIDPIWSEVRREAEEAVRAEPALAGFLRDWAPEHPFDPRKDMLG